MCNLIWEMTSWYQWHEIDTNHGTAKRGRWGQCWPHPCAASNLNSSRSWDFRGQCLSLRWDDLLIRLTDDIILLKTIFFHALDCTSMLQVHYYHYTLIQQKKNEPELQYLHAYVFTFGSKPRLLSSKCVVWKASAVWCLCLWLCWQRCDVTFMQREEFVSRVQNGFPVHQPQQSPTMLSKANCTAQPYETMRR